MQNTLEKDFQELLTAVEPESTRWALTSLYEWVKAELKTIRSQAS